MTKKSKLDEKTANVYAEYAAEEAKADASPMDGTVNLSVRVSESLAARLRFRAGNEGISLSDLMRRLLGGGIERPLTPAQEARIVELIDSRLGLAA